MTTFHHRYLFDLASWNLISKQSGPFCILCEGVVEFGCSKVKKNGENVNPIFQHAVTSPSGWYSNKMHSAPLAVQQAMLGSAGRYVVGVAHTF